MSEPTPPPKSRIGDAIKAALDHMPRRPGDQFIYWPIKATKELGFSVTVALILLLKMPLWIKDAVGVDAGIRGQQHLALLDAIERNSDAFAKTTAALETVSAKAEEMRPMAEWLRGVVAGRLKCPDLACAPCRPCPTCLPATVNILPSPAAQITSTPAPPSAGNRRER